MHVLLKLLLFRIGTEKRGVELPHVNQNFETNVPGIYIAGELGGMGLIKNAVEQGRQAVENIAKSVRKNHTASYDLIIIGAGPAGISGSLTAQETWSEILVAGTGYSWWNSLSLSQKEDRYDISDGPSSLW